ncbi:MAG TPA: ice-binding family protein [Bacteroidia bacterium]|jgi:uncharacterized repeat protein (TIGR01451 family)/gliding motility-associated-like protein
MKSKLLTILIAIGIMSVPKVNFGQTPNLGTAADFVLFTTVGAVTNTGISHLTGNVGTNSGSSTGFGNVNGVMHDNDGASAAAVADLTLAYNQLNSAVPTFFPAPLLGNGQILNAGVYSIAGPATLNLVLTLDGQNNPSAVFIFQISGAFATNAAAKVKLINGAKACNVFWKVEGMVSMATQTSMKGNIVANNSAIAMSTNDTLEGRALAINGAITLDGTLAYTPIGCGSPVLTGPNPPALASSACYTLFSSDGPVTNAGVTNVTGDIGTNNGTVTGHNPLLVVGAIHGVPDASTALASSDILNVYNYLNTLPFDIELLYPVQFGNNLVLTPHVYRMSAAATFTDTLYLDAQGDPNAVFVIQINGALSTSTYSKVNLINGAQSKNVFWKVEGAVSINDYSIFRGTIISNNGAISLTTGVYLDGRAFTTTGALATAAVTAIMPPGCGLTTAPTITTQPGGQTVCEGSSASFSVVASGSGLTYQWRKGNTNLVNGGNISGATTSTLTINPATISDAAINYNVIVSDGTTSDTSVNVSLIIDTAPSISLQPSDQAACIGGSVSFSVTANGTGLNYQWRKGNIDLINGGSVSGVTTSMLTINPAILTDTAYNYNVVITGSCGNDTSQNAALVMAVMPVIVLDPMDQTVCAGDSVNISVTAIGAALTYQWRKGTVNLVNGGSFSGVNTANLVINPVSVSDTAFNYNVIVMGGCSMNDTSVNMELAVNTAPQLTSQPSGQIVCAGSTVSFSVSATGTGITYQWRKGIVNLINGGNISGANSPVLTINPASTLDTAYNYNVIVSGVCGPNDTSVNVSLILDQTVINSQPANENICEGAAASFSVSSLGSGISYQWRRGNVNLLNGGNISGANSSTLSINPALASDAANNYNVIISGNCSPNDTSVNVSLAVTASPVALASSNSPVCSGSAINLSASAVAGASYSWTATNGYSSALQNPVIPAATVSDAGTYSLVVTVNGCNSSTSNTIVSVTNCSADLSIVKTVNNTHPIFGNNVVFTITVTNNGPDNANGVEVIDILQEGYVYVSSSATTGTYDPLSGEWTVGTLNNGASATLSITVTVVEGGNYVNTAITYSANIEADMNNNSSSVETIPSDFFIPEGFSPNGDNINDRFVIRGILNYPENTFVIFNRWGDKVFEASPYENTWTGKCDKGLQVGGDELPVGTYFYILDLGNNTDVYKGTIYLNK